MVYSFVHGRNLTLAVVIVFYFDIVLIKFDELSSVSADGQTGVRSYKSVN